MLGIQGSNPEALHLMGITVIIITKMGLEMSLAAEHFCVIRKHAYNDNHVKVMFYWEHPFQPNLVLVDVVEVYQQNAFQLFSIERVENTAIFLGIVGTRPQPCYTRWHLCTLHNG